MEGGERSFKEGIVMSGSVKERRDGVNSDADLGIVRQTYLLKMPTLFKLPTMNKIKSLRINSYFETPSIWVGNFVMLDIDQTLLDRC